MTNASPIEATTSLLTDRYELTMLASFIADGTVENHAVFETFARRLPAGRRYGMVAGTGRLIDLIESFTFDADDIEWLLSEGVINAATATYLTDFRFRGTIEGLREGDVYFPGTPVLTVSGSLGECVVLETLILSVLNHDTAIASAAARMVTAAAGRPLIEMGSRRTHEQAAVATARAAYIAGFASTSNLAAGRLHGIPTVGTAAHAFTLAHAGIDRYGDPSGEMAAFRSQVDTHGTGTTLLVDTYDIAQGIRHAVAATRQAKPGSNGPGAIRIDSGDLAEEAHRARTLLDDLGAVDTRITVTSDLDEYVITALGDAPIDGYGAGTRVATGSGHPTAGFVYKLVAIADRPGVDAPLRPVAKRATGKGSVGGRKRIVRHMTKDGMLVGEAHLVDGASLTDTLLAQAAPIVSHPVVTLISAGQAASRPTLEETRGFAAARLASLPPGALDVATGTAVIEPVVYGPAATPEPTADDVTGRAGTVTLPHTCPA